ncbi:3-hydroxyisobutyrate dehydrogenase [Microbacterium trichothecenolyticum]|uniref:NAD(P)-dependent oxidoreductase n=1 Tax=Microbacterium trichothecenolyticum TaxID=69370 RepID=UPI00285E6C21|nr:NAD(P)-dependent oxidoreductase [Microbacterium trichothecenolyticum]MDR7110901.1 3-hydroxyisobutyrate dehydrogenase [Microbacterium trichothecenolyticum]
MSVPAIGFVGLGRMGTPMATRLAAAGYALQVADAVPAAVAAFLVAQPGAALLDLSEQDPLDELDILIVMLPDSNIVEAVLEEGGLAGRLRRGALVIDMSSSEPLRTTALAQRLGGLGLRLIDAPVSGGVRGAIAGTLSTMVGGAGADLDEARPVLEHLAATVIHVGEVGSGHAAKALNNLVSATTVSVTVEALQTAARFGIDPAMMTEVLNSSSGRTNTSERKVAAFMLSGTFDSGFTLPLMSKDVSIAVDLAHRIGTPGDVSDAVAQQWRGIASFAARDADHTEMYRLIGASGSEERSARS